MSASSLSGSLLVAMPQLQDPNFTRTVVLLIEHDEGGTFGLVLNRGTGLSARELCSSLDVAWNGDPEHEIQWGGPVQPNTGWVVFGDGARLRGDEEGVCAVTDGVSFAGSLDVLRSIALAPPPDVRFFLGYAGWGPGQLESELAQGAWLVAPLTLDLAFGVDGEELWNEALRDLGVDPATLVSTSGVH